MEVEWEMDLPDVATFKDMHAGVQLQDITINRIKAYMDSNDKTFDPKSNYTTRGG